MNDLHLKYQQDTGIRISALIESLRGTYNDDCSEVYDYIVWLENHYLTQPIQGSITIPGYLKGITNEKDKTTDRSTFYHDRHRDR